MRRQKLDDFIAAGLLAGKLAGEPRPALLPTEWTAVERIQVATVLLNHIRKLQHSPNHAITTVLYVLNDDPATLNDNRDLATMLRALETL